MQAYIGCTACDIPICGGLSAALFSPGGAVFAEPSDVIFALWFPDGFFFFFAARAESEVAFHVVQEFCYLISLGKSVLFSLIWFICITIWSCFANSKHFSLFDEQTRSALNE